MPKVKMGRKRLIAIVAVVAAAVSFGPALSARAALLPQVNEALTAGGFALTLENWQPFAAGVVTGHYASFKQLADATKFHKQRGTLPEEGKFAKTVARVAGTATGTTPGKTTCTIGQVKSFSMLKKVTNKAEEGRLTLEYAKKTKEGKKTVSKLTSQPYKLSKAQFDIAKNRGVVIGRQAKICTKATLTGKTIAAVGNVLNLAPVEDPDDSTGGGSSGGGGGGS